MKEWEFNAVNLPWLSQALISFQQNGKKLIF